MTASAAHQLAAEPARLVLKALFPNVTKISFLSQREGWSISFRAMLSGVDVVAKFTRNAGKGFDTSRSFKDVAKYIAAIRLSEALSSGEAYLAVREYKPAMLNDRLVGDGWLSAREVKMRTLILRDVVQGIAELHDGHLTHGDIRPNRISVDRTGAELVDFQAPTPFSLLTPAERNYRLGGEVSYAGDLYSAGQLFEEVLLRRLRFDNHLPYFSIAPRELAWLADYLRSNKVTGSSTAAFLRLVLFGPRTDVLDHANRKLTSARKELTQLANKNNRLFVSFKDIEFAAQRAQEEALARIEMWPTTALALEKSGQARVALALMPIDHYSIFPHTVVHKQENSAAEEFEKHLPSTIDDRWRSQLERQAATYATGKAYEAAVADSVEFADQLRRELLADTAYIDDVSLAAEMSREDLEVTPGSLDVIRQWGYLFGVRDHDHWLYPMFQFEAGVGVQDPAVRAVNAEFDDDESEWSILSWWLTPHASLGGEPPATVVRMKGGGDRVINAVKDSLS